VGEPGGSGPAPRPSAPPVQQLVVRYAKRGKMRFASQLDVARAVERGVRRAGLPIAYSSGFTPHPKISYAGGVPTGVASEAEYLSLALTSQVEAAEAGKRLNAALPDGIDVIAVTEETGGLPAGRLTASEWQVLLPGLTPDNVVPVVQSFLALEHAPVERLTAKGMRRMDARSAVVHLDARCLPGGRPPVPPDARPMAQSADGIGRADGVRGESPSGDNFNVGTELRMILRHTVPSVRPDDVLTALRQVSDVIPTAQPLMTRLAQGSLGESGVVEP
jgi:radical SAM-linked protein